MTDIHPELGRRQYCPDLDTALGMVRTVWPSAYKEGSTGNNYSFWYNGILVGHWWKANRRNARGWLRIKSE